MSRALPHPGKDHLQSSGKCEWVGRRRHDLTGVLEGPSLATVQRIMLKFPLPCCELWTKTNGHIPGILG